MANTYTVTVHADIVLEQTLTGWEVVSVDIPQDVEIGDEFSVGEMLALEEHCLRT